MDELLVPDPQPPLRETSRPQRLLAALLFAFFAGATLYRFLMHENLGHSAAMFLGIPALLAILLALAPTPKSATGSILRGIALAVLVVAPLLGEGYLCILFASPLFFLVGLIIGAVVDHNRRQRGVTLTCVALVMLPVSLEGIVPQLTHNRLQTVTVTQTIGAPSAAVEAALAQSPQIHVRLPGLLRIGFPQPLEAHGSGLELHNTRTIHFTGAEGNPPGDLVMAVTRRTPNSVRFTAQSDTSKITQWVRWKTSDVSWKALDADHTSVTWTITFSRQLDPFWYFAPWQQLAVHQAARYLIAANATPSTRDSR